MIGNLAKIINLEKHKTKSVRNFFVNRIQCGAL